MLLRVEGSTKLMVPVRATKSVFYNPRMELCRDIDIAAIAALSQRMVYLDALAGIGVRGIRVANEIGLPVVLNERSKEAYEVIKRNMELNGIEAELFNEDANILMRRRRYDIVDIDPFGSPVPFLDSVAQSANRLVLVTATDTAPLCGAHTSGLRRYAAMALNTEYHKEMATRILLGRLVRDMCRYDKAIQPLLSYSKSHFVRVIARLDRGAMRADECMQRLGFIVHCFSCGNRFAVHELLGRDERCDICGGRLKAAGPLYLAPMKDDDFCAEVYHELNVRELGRKREALKLIGACMDELDMPYYYEYHNICRALRISPPPVQYLIDALRASGYKASRTHFSDTGFKTDASIEEIKSILKR